MSPGNWGNQPDWCCFNLGFPEIRLQNKPLSMMVCWGGNPRKLNWGNGGMWDREGGKPNKVLLVIGLPSKWRILTWFLPLWDFLKILQPIVFLPSLVSIAYNVPGTPISPTIPHGVPAFVIRMFFFYQKLSSLKKVITTFHFFWSGIQKAKIFADCIQVDLPPSSGAITSLRIHCPVLFCMAGPDLAKQILW